LKNIFVPKREEVAGWRKLHIEELHNVYSSLNVNRVIESKRMRGVGGTGSVHGRDEKCLQNLVKNLKGRDYLWT
jgi:hypothetical protein